MQPHVHMADLVLRLWFGIVNGLAVDILIRNSFMSGYKQRIFPFFRKITFVESKPVYIGLLTRGKEKSSNAIVTNDIRTMTESPSKDDLRFAREVITPRLESFVLVSAMAGQLLIKSKP